MSAGEPILRKASTDGEYVTKRLAVLEQWAQTGEVEPWVAVVLAELVRLDDGRGVKPTEADFEALFLNEQLVELMRDQVDGPYLVYVEQAFAQRSNVMVMGFLNQLEDAMGSM